MPRPQTNTVPYFSHDTDALDKKTLTIIRGIFGLEGVGFWWTLLEWLGKTENHYYNASGDGDLEFLLQKLGISTQIGISILNKLSELRAIDPILWEHKIIWSQNFVSRLDLVYKKRMRELPQKPNFCNGNCDHTHLTTTITVTETPISGSESTQSKVKYSKEKNNNGFDKNLSDIVTCYESNIGRITPNIAEELKVLSDEYKIEWFSEACKEACLSNVRTLKYVKGILRNWSTNGYKSVSKKKKGTDENW